MSYSNEQFERDVILFNKCCGNPVPTDDMSDDEVMGILQRQINIVNEEVLETITALSTGDMVELLDGVVDVQYTLIWLQHLSVMVGRFSSPPPVPASWSGWLDVLQPLAETCRQMFSVDTISEANRRVAENNNSKFTTDYSVAKQWVDGVDFEAVVAETVVDGITYYYIKDANGKIRKKACFVGVDLSDLV